MPYELTNHHRFHRKEIIATDPPYQLPMSRSGKISVGVVPGAAGSMTVEYSLAPTDTPEEEKEWREWEWGVVTNPVDDVLEGPVGEIRVTATDANGILELVFARN